MFLGESIYTAHVKGSRMSAYLLKTYDSRKDSFMKNTALPFLISSSNYAEAEILARARARAVYNPSRRVILTARKSIRCIQNMKVP